MLAFLPSALLLLPLVVKANVFITAPIGTSEIQAGKKFDVEWQDDGEKPALKTLGEIEIEIWTGSQTKQTKLASLGTSSATKKTLSTVIPKDVGPSGTFYFLRVHGANSTDPNDDIFSARFAVTGATGTFSSSIIEDLGTLAGTLAPTSSAAASSATPVAASKTSLSATGTKTGLTATGLAAASSTASVTSSASTIKVGVSGVLGVVSILAYFVL